MALEGVELVEKLRALGLDDPANLKDVFDLARHMRDKELVREVKEKAGKMARELGSMEFFEMYREALRHEATYDLDSYLLYLEFDRPAAKKFYLPRRHVLRSLVADLQDLEDGKLDFLSISTPPRVGKLLADETEVLSDRGWVDHGDLKIGDRVLDMNYEWKWVLAVHPKHHTTHTLRLSDGSEFHAHENHQWLYWSHSREWLSSTVGMEGKRIPVISPSEGEDIELPVDPYDVGSWLGVDPFGRVSPLEGRWLPYRYLIASRRQRLELLAGILDAGGRHRSGAMVWSTCSETAARDFETLVASLGFHPEKRLIPPDEGVIGGYGDKPIWEFGVLSIWPIPLRVPGKTPHVHKGLHRGFRRVEKVWESEPRPGNCVTVQGGVYLVGRTLVPTRNSTLGCFFMTWLMGKYPHLANLMSGHSEKLTSGFYKEILSVLTDSQYNWSDVFPGSKIANTSAKDLSVDIDERRRFPTLTCRSIGGTLTGAVEVGKCLYCDDLIEDLEEALNPQRLENKYDAYANQLKDRMKEGAYQLMIGTRWSVADVQGRIEAQYKDNPRYRFRIIPALNEKGESNFLYHQGHAFSKEYYEDMKDSIDDATWAAKYMGMPYEREGLLFPRDDLNYYNGSLPGEPDRVVAVCDVAWGGGDSLAMPFFYIYDEKVFVHDVIFNRGDKTVTRPLVIGKMKLHRPHMSRWESDSGGHEYCLIVDETLRREGIKLNISHRRAPNNKSKLARIIQVAPEIKKFYYRDFRNSDQEYREFMKELTSFTMTGKNSHDDAPDSLAMAVDFITYGFTGVEVFKRPF